jgi:hypothetical protein
VGKFRVCCVTAVLILVLVLAASGLAQEPQDNCVFYSNQEVRVTNLAPLATPAKDTTVVLATALETILHDKTVCCGKDSALEETVLHAGTSDPVSLKELSGQLQGRHLLSDGRPIVVNAEYIPVNAMNAATVIGALREQHAALFEWKSHVYVLYGAVFNENRCYSGLREDTVVKFLLLDPRFSDQRKEVVFSRETDDLGKVQGLVTVAVAAQ